MKRNFFYVGALLASSFFLQSCKDDVLPVHEEEEITHLILEIETGENITKYVYDEEAGLCIESESETDCDGVKITLNKSVDYNVSLKFENRSDANNIEDVTEEVIEEADEHFIVYDSTSLTNLSITRSEDDTTRSDNKKIGLETIWSADTASTGTITIKLIHSPNTVDDVGVGSYTGGETDAEVTLDVEVIGAT